jgi:hypothetical protein
MCSINVPTGDDPAAKEASPPSSICYVQPLLDISPQLHPAETTSISQLEAHLEAAPVNHNIIEQSDVRQQIGVHHNVSYSSSPNADEVDLIPTLVDSMRIVLYIKVTVVGDEHELICSVLIS